MVAVAQLAEHLSVDQDVAGSSPVSHPIKKSPHRGDFLFLKYEFCYSFKGFADSRALINSSIFTGLPT